jgi:hypothetical protein
MRPRKVPLGGAPRGAASKIPAGLQDKGIEAVVVTTETATDKIRERAPSCWVRLYVQV